jgi:hypothetical protein
MDTNLANKIEMILEQVASKLVSKAQNNLTRKRILGKLLRALQVMFIRTMFSITSPKLSARRL